MHRDPGPYAGDALRVNGPPGTGKTTYLAKRIAATVQEHGPFSTMVSSFSVTAAREAASRFHGASVRPDDSMIGTLHSHAFRTIGAPSVALDSKTIVDWNEQNRPEWRITAQSRHGGGDRGIAYVDDPSDAENGDELLSALDRMRAAMVEPEEWPPNLKEFGRRWMDWKRDVGACDFTDMIEHAYAMALDGQPPPGNPSRFVTDEAQDLTPLEFALSREWGSLCEKWIIAGDDDQSINRWRGGDPGPLLALHGDDVRDHTLDQSYRVPEAVRAASELWIRRVSQRLTKVYSPRRDDAGEVVTGAAYHVPQRINSIALVENAVTEIEKGRRVMILAACNYMLTPLLAHLRAEGIPFHNPYRPSDAAWNPLGQAGEDKVSTAERVARYLLLAERDWTGQDIKLWADLIKLDPAGMRQGAKAAIAKFAAHSPVPFADIEDLFVDPQALARAVTPDLDWLAGALLAGRRKAAEYPLHIARRRGVEGLREAPRLVVGTIHSVKGGDADVVYLCPDVSAAGARSMAKDRAGVDETIRQFYVGMTRARQELRVLAPSSRAHVKPSQLIPPSLEVMP